MRLADELNLLVSLSEPLPDTGPIDNAYAITVRTMRESARRGKRTCCLPEGLFALDIYQRNILLTELEAEGISSTTYTFAYDPDLHYITLEW